VDGDPNPTAFTLKNFFLRHAATADGSHYGAAAPRQKERNMETAMLCNNGFEEDRAWLAAAPEPIATVGMGCRFPGGASSPQAFRELLPEGVDAVCEVPATRWDWRRFYDPDPDKPRKSDVKRGRFLREQAAEFDPLFFGISPGEAAVIDRQQRLPMEVPQEAMEDGSRHIEDQRGSATGVCVGTFAMDMKLLHPSVYNRDSLLATTTTARSMTLLANRLYYGFDRRGPSLPLDTACSLGLVAAHYACQSLRSKGCDLAVAGGANEPRGHCAGAHKS
jgi:acyl transferase domain-containing protein